MALTLAQRVADRADRRANPPEKAAIAAWYESDCGHAKGCPSCQGSGPCTACGRCASCAACRPEQRTPEGEWDGWLMLGGRGCVAPWTRVYLPLEDRWERVDVLARTASPVAVLALGDAGEHVAWTDGAPFVKGIADYWTVKLDDGEVITVTDQHRFLTRTGWRRLADVRPGLHVGVGPLAPPVTGSSSLSRSRGGVPRSTETLVGSPPLPDGPQREIERPSLDIAKWSRVVAVRPAGSGPYYDMTVPGAASYLAEGIWNHNSGKTRPGSEDHCKFAQRHPFARQAIVAPTFADARDTCVEGESGIQATLDRYGWTEGREYVWNRSIGEIRYLNGGKAKLFSAEKPARLRGPQHHRAWIDELAQVIQHAPDAWDMMLFGLRLGVHPQWVATTTPLPLALIKELVGDPTVHLTRMRMQDNIANLAAVTVRALYKKYRGTELGRQELDGDLLEDLPGALWKRAQLDRDRLDDGLPDWTRTESGLEIPFQLVRTVVAIDPAMGEDEGDETGIIVMGLGNDDHLYLLADYSCRADPGDWVSFILAAYDAHDANEVIIETNNGGKALADLIRKQEKLDGRHRRPVPVRMINAKKGKRARAETPSAMCQQGRVRHVLDQHQWEKIVPQELLTDESRKFDQEFKHLEDQLTTWLSWSNKSPDRLDAYVYAVLHLSDAHPGEMYSTKMHVPRHSGAAATSGNRFQLHTASNFRR